MIVICLFALSCLENLEAQVKVDQELEVKGKKKTHKVYLLLLRHRPPTSTLFHH